jgi:transketolase
VRTAFIETLCELAAADPRIWLLTGDLGFSVLEVFAGRFSDRYVNVGVAEQNMTGVAAGLAMSGKVVFTYSIANFPTLRCLEQIRNDICYHQANVKVVAVGGGLSYGNLGYTHHGIEDLAVMRVLPGMVVAAPGDPVETRAVTRMIAAREGPAYLRLGKAGELVVHEHPVDLELGQALVLRDGKDVAIVSTGATLKLAVTAAELLGRDGIAAAVISVPVLKPLDAQTILDAAKRTGRVVTVEEHKQGGLGSVVAELIATQAHGCRLGMVRLPDEIFHAAGSQDHLRRLGGLTVENLLETVHHLLRD